MTLDGMTTKDLRSLKERIDATIARKQSEAKAELQQRFVAMAGEHGLELAELFPGSKARGKPKALPRWRDAKTGVTWSGMGRRPFKFDIKRAERIG